MKTEFLEKVTEVRNTITAFQITISKYEHLPIDLIGSIQSDLTIALRSIGMVPPLLSSNYRDAMYYFNRACTLVGIVQGKIMGYKYAEMVKEKTP